MTETSAPSRKLRRAPLYFTVAAWAIPILVLGRFAFLAVAPVAIIVIAAFRDSRVQPLRWWVSGLMAVYAVPFLFWALHPDRAESLSKDIHPIAIALIVMAALAVLAKIYTRRKR